MERPCGPLASETLGKTTTFAHRHKPVNIQELNPLDHPFDPEGQVPTLWVPLGPHQLVHRVTGAFCLLSANGK
jgi:hypothetical protein